MLFTLFDDLLDAITVGCSMMVINQRSTVHNLLPQKIKNVRVSTRFAIIMLTFCYFKLTLLFVALCLTTSRHNET